MKLEELRAKYPYLKVISEPAEGCTCCQGTGEFINAKKEHHACLCTCLGGDAKIRADVTKMFQESIHRIVEDLRSKRRTV